MNGLIEVAQIGDVPLAGMSIEVYPYDLDKRAVEEPDELLADGMVTQPSNPFQFRATEVTIDADILPSAGALAEATVSRLAALVSESVDIFGVLPVQNGRFGVDAIWLHTRGVLTRLRRRPDEDGTSGLELELTINAQWEPINRLLYELTQTYESGLNTYPTPSTPAETLLSVYPTWDEYIIGRDTDNGLRWKYRPHHAALMYDPVFWPYITYYMPAGFPSLGESNDWTDIPFIQTTVSDSGLWNGRPLIVWALRQLQSAYPINLKIWRPERFGGLETITITPATLNTILTSATGTGLQSTDVLLFGDVPGRAVVVRNGAVVAHCISALSSYIGIPGFIPAGEIVNYQVMYDEASTAQWANLIMWRRIG